MKTHLINPLSVTSLLLLFLFTGCDRLAGLDDGDPGCALGTGKSGAECTLAGDEFSFRFTPEEESAGLLFSASGAIQDHGRVEGDIMYINPGDPLSQNWRGGRALRGSAGIITLSFEGQALSEDGRVLTGRFKIMNTCTESYAGLRGEGTFKVHFDEKGDRVEELFSGKIIHP